MTDLAGTQISSLMETLPGIAHVLRSPVADAFINLIRAGSGQAAFSVSDADEVMKYAVRRNLVVSDEAERILAEAREALAVAAAAAKAKPPKLPAAAAPARPVAKKPAPVKKKPAAKPSAKKSTRPAAKKSAARKVVARKTGGRPTPKKSSRPAARKPAPKK